MTTQFDNYFHNLIENMTVNDVANVGTGWNDRAGGVPKILGPIQRRKKPKKQTIKENITKYHEIEFVCCNPEYPNATKPETQKQMFEYLQTIDGAIPLLQDWGEGQTSLTVVYKNPDIGKRIKKAANQIGIDIDLIQTVDDNYVDRIVRGEHAGQIN